MKNKVYLGYKAYWLLIPIAVALLGIIVGSFADQALSNAIYDPNDFFGAFCETFGETIGYMMAPVGGTLVLLGLIKKDKKWVKAIGIVLFLIAYGLAVWMFARSINYKTDGYGLRLPQGFTWLAYLLSVILMSIPAVLVYFMVDLSKADRLTRVGLIILFSMGIGMVLVNYFLKYLGGRPRWRYLVDATLNTEGYTFHYWWQMMPFAHMSGDYFKSWPSGHTLTAAVTLLLPLCSSINKKKFAVSPLFFYIIGFAYTLIIAYARIRYGAHFLSDVSFGLLITACLNLIAVPIGVEKIHPEPKEEAEPIPQE